MRITTLLTFCGIAAANPFLFPRGNPNALPAAGVTGIATFNSYAKQLQSGQNLNCYPDPNNPPPSISSAPYGAAVGDLSPSLAISSCTAPGTYPTSCSTTNGVILPTPTSGYAGPNCASSVPCGLCFKVTNQGAIGTQGDPNAGKCAYVRIIDACPHNSAFNYCKQAPLSPPLQTQTPVPTNQRCSDGSTNALDIDTSAYQALAGQGYANGLPNLNILVQPFQCSDVPAGGQCTAGGAAGGQAAQQGDRAAKKAGKGGSGLAQGGKPASQVGKGGASAQGQQMPMAGKGGSSGQGGQTTPTTGQPATPKGGKRSQGRAGS